MKEEKPQCPRLDVRPYVGRWISLNPETHEVVADGLSLKEARDAAIMKGIRRPLLMMVPKSEGYFVGAGNPV